MVYRMEGNRFLCVASTIIISNEYLRETVYKYLEMSLAIFVVAPKDDWNKSV